MTNTGHDARALTIRDHLVPLIRTHGSMQEVSGRAGWLAVCRMESLTCTLRSPFTAQFAEAPLSAFFEQSISRQRAKPDLPWGLDVWHGSKVLSLQWDDEGRAEVMSFIRGPWEAAALAMGADRSPSN